MSFCGSIDVESRSQDLAGHLLMQHAFCLSIQPRKQSSSLDPGSNQLQDDLLQDNFLASFRIACYRIISWYLLG